MSKNSKDLLVSIVCLIFSLCFLWVIIPSQIPLPKFSSGGTTPRAIPKTCCWLIIVMSLVIFIRVLRTDRRCVSVLWQELLRGFGHRESWRTFGYVSLVFGLSVIYYIGYATAGFFITTLVLFPVYGVVLGCRKPVPLILTDLILTFGVYYSFAVFMNCYLPGWAPF